MKGILFRNKYRIQSARLANYDYGQPGFYFVTICTKNRINYFGKILDGKMVLNDVGKMAKQYWLEIPNHFLNAKLDEFIVMPNHTHGIIIIGDGGNGRGEALPRLYHGNNHYNGQHPNMSSISPKPHSLPVIIGSYKSICTKIINQRHGYNYFAWQSRYHDHIIRTERALYNIRRYIINNPAKWWRDRNNYGG